MSRVPSGLLDQIMHIRGNKVAVSCTESFFRGQVVHVISRRGESRGHATVLQCAVRGNGHWDRMYLVLSPLPEGSKVGDYLAIKGMQ